MGMSRKARQVLRVHRFPVGVLEHKYPQKSNLEKNKKSIDKQKNLQYNKYIR